MSVSVIDSLKDAVVVASLVCDCDNVCVTVEVRASDSDSVKEISCVSEGVSDFAAVRLADCVNCCD